MPSCPPTASSRFVGRSVGGGGRASISVFTCHDMFRRRSSAGPLVRWSSLSECRHSYRDGMCAEKAVNREETQLIVMGGGAEEVVEGEERGQEGARKKMQGRRITCDETRTRFVALND